MPPEPQPEDWSSADWERLAELRERFLSTTGEEGGGWGSSWRDERELELYDESFACRIAWKWEAVLDELAARGWAPPGGHVHDFATGTGVALRAVLARFGAPFERVTLWDRSPLARSFGIAAVRREHPGIEPREALPSDTDRIDLLLASHVLGELDERGGQDLRERLSRSRAALFVEPGSRAASRALGRFREELADEFTPIAPCPHAGPCGVFAPGAEAHWCHFFARPPYEAFAERRWTLFSKRLHIDLRSLPYAYLLLERHAASEPPRSGDASRILGRARLEKGRAALFVCSAEGLREHTLLERDDRAFFKALREPPEPGLVRLEPAGPRIRSVTNEERSLERAAERAVTLTPSDVRELGDGRALTFDAVLGEERARSIALELAAPSAALRPAGIGQGASRSVDPEIRGDSTAWLERAATGPLVDLWHLFDGLRTELALRAWLPAESEEVQLALYATGTAYKRHRDAFARESRRRATAIYYLNDWQPEDGGELRLFEPSGPRTIPPLLDRLVLFLSDRMEHEVLPTRVPRLAVTCWFLGPRSSP